MERLTGKFFTLLGVIFIVGCANVAVREPESGPPEWVANPPIDDESFIYFIGSGSSLAGDRAEAEELAREIIVGDIVRYVGVAVTSETEVVAKGTLDSFESEITQHLTAKSAGRIAGLEIIGRWEDRKNDSITVYLQSRYERSELLKERDRIENIFKEILAAINRPEEEARTLENSGHYFGAAIKSVEAAAAVMKSDLENAEMRFEANINRAKQALDRINLVAFNDRVQAITGREVLEPFRVKVAAGVSEYDSGIADVNLEIRYTVLTTGGKKKQQHSTLKSNDEGIVVFLHPVPFFVGTAEVVVSLDVAAHLKAVADVPASLGSSVDGLKDMVKTKKLVLFLDSISMAQEIETGIVFLNVDSEGKPMERQETADGLLESLTTKQFKVRVIAFSTEMLLTASDADIVSQLATEYQDDVERVIYGTAKLSDHEEDNDMVIVSVTGAAKAVELATGDVLLSVQRTKGAIGKNFETALGIALRKLGEDLGAEIANNLR